MSVPNGRRLATSAHRLHVLEFSWFDRTGTTRLFRYDFDAIDFAHWYDASGQWGQSRRCQACCGNRDGQADRCAAQIELRPVPNLRRRVGLVMTANWDFSCVRLLNAMPPDADTQ